MDIDPTKLETKTQLAERFGVHPSAISNWQKRDLGFPEPTLHIGSSKLYLIEEVTDWYENRVSLRNDTRSTLQKQIDELRQRVERLEKNALR